MRIKIAGLAGVALLTLSAAHSGAIAQTYTFRTVKYNGMNTSMHDINDSKVGVGGAFDPGATIRPCIVVTGKTITPLSDPKAVNGTECWGIASNGTIVGDYFDANSVAHGYMYANGKFTSIKPPGATTTVVYGVNASNVAIGYYIDGS